MVISRMERSQVEEEDERAGMYAYFIQMNRNREGFAEETTWLGSVGAKGARHGTGRIPLRP